nr:MAG TPA: hypothetical protein [Bacteriophage sp.]
MKRRLYWLYVHKKCTLIRCRCTFRITKHYKDRYIFRTNKYFSDFFAKFFTRTYTNARKSAFYLRVPF